MQLFASTRFHAGGRNQKIVGESRDSAGEAFGGKSRAAFELSGKTLFACYRLLPLLLQDRGDSVVPRMEGGAIACLESLLGGMFAMRCRLANGQDFAL